MRCPASAANASSNANAPCFPAAQIAVAKLQESRRQLSVAAWPVPAPLAYGSAASVATKRGRENPLSSPAAPNGFTATACRRAPAPRCCRGQRGPRRCWSSGSGAPLARHQRERGRRRSACVPGGWPCGLAGQRWPLPAVGCEGPGGCGWPPPPPPAGLGRPAPK